MKYEIEIFMHFRKNFECKAVFNNFLNFVMNSRGWTLCAEVQFLKISLESSFAVNKPWNKKKIHTIQFFGPNYGEDWKLSLISQMISYENNKRILKNNT